MGRHLLSALIVAISLGFTLQAIAQKLVVWHDLGDNGIKWFNELNQLYAKTHPDVSITSVSYPTDQWYGKVIAAINTDTAPDLIYNNYEGCGSFRTTLKFSKNPPKFDKMSPKSRFPLMKRHILA